jgi:hypothetical protein
LATPVVVAGRYYNSRVYPFRIPGLGIGEIGASTISAEGEVYKLNNLVSIPDAYAPGRCGFALGNRSGGDLWMKTDACIILLLQTHRTDVQPGRGCRPDIGVTLAMSIAAYPPKNRKNQSSTWSGASSFT